MSTFTSDTMTDTAGTLITAHTGETGATWTDGTGSISANRTAITAAGRLRGNVTGTTYWSYASGVPAGADAEITADLYVATAAGSDAVGCGLRADTAAQTLYFARHKTNVSPNVWSIEKQVAGTGTTLGTTNATLTDGNTYGMDLTVVGTTLNLSIDGALTVGPITDSAISAAGRACIRFTCNVATPGDTVGLHLDNLVATSGFAEANDLLLLTGPTRVRFTN